MAGSACKRVFSSYAAIHRHTIAIIRGFLATHQHEIMHIGEAVSTWLAERQLKVVHTKTHAMQWLNVFGFCIFLTVGRGVYMAGGLGKGGEGGWER